MRKQPPPEKIFEAWGAIAGGRVHLHNLPEAETGTATILSSDGQKEYQASWSGNVYACNDNATFWQGYPGYPVIALLMLRKKIPYNTQAAQPFAHVDWHDFNRKAHNDYQAALQMVFAALQLDRAKGEWLLAEAQMALQALLELDIVVKRYYPHKKS